MASLQVGTSNFTVPSYCLLIICSSPETAIPWSFSFSANLLLHKWEPIRLFWMQHEPLAKMQPHTLFHTKLKDAAHPNMTNLCCTDEHNCCFFPWWGMSVITHFCFTMGHGPVSQHLACIVLCHVYQQTYTHYLPKGHNGTWIYEMVWDADKLFSNMKDNVWVRVSCCLVTVEMQKIVCNIVEFERFNKTEGSRKTSLMDSWQCQKHQKLQVGSGIYQYKLERLHVCSWLSII